MDLSIIESLSAIELSAEELREYATTAQKRNFSEKRNVHKRAAATLRLALMSDMIHSRKLDKWCVNLSNNATEGEVSKNVWQIAATHPILSTDNGAQFDQASFIKALEDLE